MATDPLPARDTCCAVVVTYHPDDGLPGRVSRIAEQVARVYVVDNASGEGERRMLARIAGADPSIELVLLDANEGLGAALNRGFARAIAGGFGWVVAFDQDTLVEPGMIDELAAIHGEHPRRDLVKLVAPNYLLATGDPGIRLPRGSGRWKETNTAITSGALISVAGYRLAGPFREDYFIDSIDEEFCLRLRRRGMVVVCSRKPLMRHALGSAKALRLPWGSVTISHHAPFRHYYIARNRILTLREYAPGEPAWALSRLYITVRELVATALLSNQRGAKLRAMFRGLWHGLLGRSGKDDGIS